MLALSADSPPTPEEDDVRTIRVCGQPRDEIRRRFTKRDAIRSGARVERAPQESGIAGLVIMMREANQQRAIGYDDLQLVHASVAMRL